MTPRLSWLRPRAADSPPAPPPLVEWRYVEINAAAAVLGKSPHQLLAEARQGRIASYEAEGQVFVYVLIDVSKLHPEDGR